MLIKPEMISHPCSEKQPGKSMRESHALCGSVLCIDVDVVILVQT